MEMEMKDAASRNGGSSGGEGVPTLAHGPTRLRRNYFPTFSMSDTFAEY
jgi:hypothetical protein